MNDWFIIEKRQYDDISHEGGSKWPHWSHVFRIVIPCVAIKGTVLKAVTLMADTLLHANGEMGMQYIGPQSCSLSPFLCSVYS